MWSMPFKEVVTANFGGKIIVLAGDRCNPIYLGKMQAACVAALWDPKQILKNLSGIGSSLFA